MFKFFHQEYTAGQQIPKHLILFKHPVARIFVYGWTLFWNSASYYAWMAMFNMLVYNGDYSWLCDSEKSSKLAPDPSSVCNAQELALNNLYTIAYSAEFGVTLLAGWAFDVLGPLTGVIGQLMYISGWLLLMLSNELRPYYVLAFVLIGGSINFTAFPPIVLADLFPSQAVLALTYVVAAQTASTLGTLLLEYCLFYIPGMTFKTVILIYLFAISIPSAIVFVLALPAKRPLRQDPATDEFPIPTSTTRIFDRHFTSEASGVFRSQSFHLARRLSSTRSPMVRRSNTLASSAFSNMLPALPYHETSTTLNSKTQDPLVKPLLDSPSKDGGCFEKSDFDVNNYLKVKMEADDNSSCHSVEAHQRDISSNNSVDDELNTDANYFQLWQEMITSEYLLFLVYYIMSIGVYGNYQTIISQYYKTSVLDFQSYVLPSQAIWSVIIGLLVKNMGTVVVSMALTVMVTAACAAPYIHSSFVAYWGVLIWVVSNSYTHTVKFTFCEEVFAPRNIGMQMGIYNMLGGLFSLLYIPLRTYSEDSDFLLLFSIAQFIPCMLVLIYLFYRQLHGLSDWRHLDVQHREPTRRGSMCKSFTDL